MFIKEIPYNYNSLKQLNSYNNKSKIYKKFKNSRSKIPFKTTFHNYNYNSISKMNNYNTDGVGRDTFYSNYSMSDNKNVRIQSLEQFSMNKNKPEMNIMINNKIIKNIFVNKNPKYKILNRNNNNIINNNKKIQNPINNFYNNINKIKQKLYNDYNLTYQNINDYKNNNTNNTNNNNMNYSNINSASKNIKTFAYKNFSGKKLLKSDNKKKQIPVPKNNYSNYQIINSQRGNSYTFNYKINNNIYENYNRNNKIMNQNKKNIKLYQTNNFYGKTNIYETEYNNIRDQIQINYNNINNNIPSKSSYTKIKSNYTTNVNKMNKHKSLNELMISKNKGIYQNTEINNANNNLISSSSSSDISKELSLIAEDIINIYKKQKVKNKEKNDKINISKNLEEDFNKSLKKININDSTEENFDLIDEIINKADLEEKNKKNRKIKFDLEKNICIKYNPKEKLLLDNKKMEFYFTLLKSKIKFNPVIKNFDKNEIRINKDYILNENLEEYEILGDLYNIFYLKDINDLDKKLKNNINDLVNKA